MHDHHILSQVQLPSSLAMPLVKIQSPGSDLITPIFIPVFDSYNEDRKLVAVMYALIDWKSYFFNILPKNVEPIVVVLANSCHGPFTYIIDGPDVQFVGAGDFHSSNMEQYAEYVDLKDLLSESINGISLNQEICQYNLTVYPTESNYNQYNTSKLSSHQVFSSHKIDPTI
jgi:hypothetical protein